MENLIKTIFPPKCFSCGVEGHDVCLKCLSECVLARHFYCLVCDNPSDKGKTHISCLQKSPAIAIFSAFEYIGVVRKCIKTAKYQRKLFAPLKTLSLEAVEIASKLDLALKGHIVTSIPLSKAKSKTRGFNQAKVIAQVVAKNFDLPYKDGLLERNIDTKAQYTADRKQRFKNIKGAFICRKDLKNQKILLVDDICTTGATLRESAKVLTQSNAQEVQCFTLAKKF